MYLLVSTQDDAWAVVMNVPVVCDTLLQVSHLKLCQQIRSTWPSIGWFPFLCKQNQLTSAAPAFNTQKCVYMKSVTYFILQIVQ